MADVVARTGQMISSALGATIWTWGAVVEV